MSPSRRCTSSETKPVSPYRKRNASTPTSGGSTAGNATSPPSSLPPGRSYRAKRNASGIPIRPASTTLASEIHRLPHNACHSVGRAKNRRTYLRVQPEGSRTPSSNTSTSG